MSCRIDGQGNHWFACVYGTVGCPVIHNDRTPHCIACTAGEPCRYHHGTGLEMTGAEYADLEANCLGRDHFIKDGISYLCATGKPCPWCTATERPSASAPGHAGTGHADHTPTAKDRDTRAASTGENDDDEELVALVGECKADNDRRATEPEEATMRPTRLTRQRRLTKPGKGGWAITRHGFVYTHPVTGNGVSAGWRLWRTLSLRREQERSRRAGAGRDSPAPSRSRGRDGAERLRSR